MKLTAYISHLYSHNKLELFSYIGILLASVGLGLLGAWIFRGEASFAQNLIMLTLGFSLPACLVIYITWTVKEEAKTRALDFLNGILICVVIGIIMQWGFFKLGKVTFGAHDFNSAVRLCEVSRSWVMQNSDSFVFSQTALNNQLADGTVIPLGNIALPRIVRIQQRTYTAEGRENIHATFLCRFWDPRNAGNAEETYYTYNYNTESWSFGGRE